MRTVDIAIALVKEKTKAYLQTVNKNGLRYVADFSTGYVRFNVPLSELETRTLSIVENGSDLLDFIVPHEN